MLQLNHQIQSADSLGELCERLPIGEVTELHTQFNVNMCDGCDSWLDSDPMPADWQIEEMDDMCLFFPGEVS